MEFLMDPNKSYSTLHGHSSPISLFTASLKSPPVAAKAFLTAFSSNPISTRLETLSCSSAMTGTRLAELEGPGSVINWVSQETDLSLHFLLQVSCRIRPSYKAMLYTTTKTPCAIAAILRSYSVADPEDKGAAPPQLTKPLHRLQVRQSVLSTFRAVSSPIIAPSIRPQAYTWPA